MEVNDFLKTMQLLSDTELMLDEDRLAQVVGGADPCAARSAAEDVTDRGAVDVGGVKLPLFRKKDGAGRGSV